MRMMIVYGAYTGGKLMKEKGYCCIWSDYRFNERKPSESNGEAS